MGKPTIKRDALKSSRKLARRFRSGDIPAVSVAQELETGRILAVGIDHGAAAEVLRSMGRADDGTWQLIQNPVAC